MHAKLQKLLNIFEIFKFFIKPLKKHIFSARNSFSSLNLHLISPKLRCTNKISRNSKRKMKEMHTQSCLRKIFKFRWKKFFHIKINKFYGAHNFFLISSAVWQTKIKRIHHALYAWQSLRRVDISELLCDFFDIKYKNSLRKDFSGI